MPLFWMLACGPDDRSELLPDGGPTENTPVLLLADSVLPTGVLGVAYEAKIPVSGGIPPLNFELDSGLLPEGLTLGADGVIRGAPSIAGTFGATLHVTDFAGQTKFAQITVPVDWDPIEIPCGGTGSGTFSSSGYGGEEGVDWADFAGYTWVFVPWPFDDTTRVELKFDADDPLTVWVPQPGAELTSHDLLDDYVPFNVDPFNSASVIIDLGTDPALAPFVDQGGVPVLIVAPGAGSWSADVECTDGPIFDWLWTLPVRQNDPIDIDFDVIGNNDGVRIWTDTEIPDFYVWDETTGYVSGTALSPGGWEIDIHAEDAFGRTRSERAILGVYDVTDLACDSSIDLVVTEGMYDGDFYGPYDPKGFDVFRLPWEGTLSGVSLAASGATDTHLGVARPYPDFPFYADALYVYTFYGDATLALGPTSYPTWSNFQGPEEVFVVAAPIYGAPDMRLSVTCDDTPRPDLIGLPVLLPELAGEATLSAVGGTEPWTWVATGLPAGIAMDPSGQLRWPPVVEGTSSVELTVTDSLGESGAATLPMFVGDDIACAPDLLVACGDHLSGAFLEPYWQSDDGPESTLVVCIVPRGHRGLWFEVATTEPAEVYVQLGDPGVSANDILQGEFVSSLAFAEPNLPSQVFVDDFIWPWMADYEALPTRVALRAYEAGDWTLDVECFDL